VHRQPQHTRVKCVAYINTSFLRRYSILKLDLLSTKIVITSAVNSSVPQRVTNHTLTASYSQHQKSFNRFTTSAKYTFGSHSLLFSSYFILLLFVCPLTTITVSTFTLKLRLKVHKYNNRKDPFIASSRRKKRKKKTFLLSNVHRAYLSV